MVPLLIMELMPGETVGIWIWKIPQRKGVRPTGQAHEETEAQREEHLTQGHTALWPEHQGGAVQGGALDRICRPGPGGTLAEERVYRTCVCWQDPL